MAGTQVVQRREAEVVREVVRLETQPTLHGARAAFQLLRAGFAILPIAAGADKFLNLLTSWEMYLATPIAERLPISQVQFMRISGVVEIAAGLLVAVAPRIGAWVVAAWLGAITVNLLIPPGFYDVALRDFGLMLGAIALGLLARKRRVAVVREPG